MVKYNKRKYTEPMDTEAGVDTSNTYYNHAPYNIHPSDMSKRIRVFKEQLIPDIVKEAKTVDEIEFAHIRVEELRTKFIDRLEQERLYQEFEGVNDVSNGAICELAVKYREAIKNAERNV